jgi:hypothetical protein
MPFTVKDASEPRFPGDFEIDSDQTLTDAETTYLAKVNGILKKLSDDQRQDQEQYDDMRPGLFKARGKHRMVEALGSLRSVAQQFAHGTMALDKASNATDDVENTYLKNLPDFAARDKPAGEARFTGDFVVASTNYQWDPEEATYVQSIASVLDTLAKDEAADKALGYPSGRLEARENCRTEAARILRKDFETFRKNGVDAAKAFKNALIAQGTYVGKRDRFELSLFNVSLKKGAAGAPDADLAVGLEIHVEDGLPPPEDAPSKEKQDLFIDINKAKAVITTVVHQMQDRAEKVQDRAANINKRWWWLWSWWWWLWFGDLRRAQAEQVLARQLLDKYLRKLEDIARIGLEGPNTSLAKLALDQTRADFTIEQAGRIKNAYVRRLGVAAALWAALLLLAYGIVHNVGTAAGWWYQHEAFLVAATGASIGTWLSFSIRRVGLAFSDLPILEVDLLDPSVRIIFVIGLTLTACLLFWTGVMNIEIGSLKTNAPDFMHKGSVAMLIGVFFGISERALATAISGRAAAFVTGIGG